MPAVFIATAQTEGITLYEPFGGMCAGLEMVLRNGFVVRRYIYSDTDAAARAVAQHRVAALSLRYPHQLHSGAFVNMFVTLPQDVTHVHTAELLRAGAKDGTWWMVVAGWECQDLSPAGSGAGLHGKHSRTFYDVVRMLGTLQQLQRSRPPAFIIENTAMQHNFNS
jgi:site-specific DNA-cytosine methylase